MKVRTSLLISNISGDLDLDSWETLEDVELLVPTDNKTMEPI